MDNNALNRKSQGFTVYNGTLTNIGAGITNATTGMLGQNSVLAKTYQFYDDGSFVIGIGANYTLGTDSIAIGKSTDASTNFSTVIGSTSNVGLGGVSIGYSIVNPFDYAVSIGYDGTITGNYGIVLGYTSTAGADALAIGETAAASGTGSISIGTSSIANANFSLCLGYDGTASAAQAIAIGFQSVASGSSSIAIGNTASATAVASIVIGELATDNTKIDSVVIGTLASTTGNFGVAIGNLTASGTSSVAIGDSSIATNFSIAIGDTANTTGGSLATAIGLLAISSGNGSIALGNSAVSSNTHTVAIGNLASATGSAGIAIGDSASDNGGGLSVTIGSSSSGQASAITIGPSAIGSNSSVTIGRDSNGGGTFSASVGPQVINSGNGSFNALFGSVISMTGGGTRNAAFGSEISDGGTAASLRTIIGHGVPAALFMTNLVANSTSIGSNSDTPTMWVTGGNGSSGSQGRVGIRTGAPASALDTQGGQTVLVVNKTVADTPYAVLVEDFMVSVDSSGGAVTVTLPAVPVKGNMFIVKDEVGQASVNNITINGNGNNIDGAATYVMTSNYESITVVFTGVTWSII